LSFSEPDLARFPCLSLAFSAAKAGGIAPTVLNAANEIAVAAFLDEGMPYLHIPKVVEKTLNAIESRPVESLEVILDVDAQARRVAGDFIRAIQL
jgi:1-deoxy-D-xylulose-5-phosphate reductoisomerase